MPDLLIASVEYGGYISPVKLIIFLILFFLWLPLTGWVYKDARAVGTKEVFWTAIVLGAGAAASLIWLLVPVFVIGMLLFVLIVAATSASYVMHRNTRVVDFERVLTADHIKGLFVREPKELDTSKDFIFITSNNNEVPVPEPKTSDFFGYKSAYDILADATRRRASDIIFLPTQQNYNITYHIDGAGLKQPAISRERMEHFIHFVKNLADLDTSERRKPQKGRFTIRHKEENTDWEVSTAGSTAGEQVKLKQMTQESITRLADIGLTAEQYEQMNKIREMKPGILIITGPKKSGVTTTFYALLKNHDAFINSIHTLERQPAMGLPNITQNVFTLSDTSTTTYAKKLQTVVRMEPDIVGVADCTDAETAQIASAAAKDGKVLYVTLEADNVLKALGKWMKLVGDRNVVAETVLGISNQRLLRRLCDECKQPYEPNRELLRKFNIPAEKVKVLYRTGKVKYTKRGKPITCENCQGTGFVGRMSVFETIMINDQLREAVRQSKSLSEIATQFRRAKMLYLQEQALKKVIDGTTSVNEMVRALSKRQEEKKREQTT
jgi:type II secretory ATPase GspE/PulE/Tfp pilus assembly ATPase PilB-like protein